MATCPSCRCTGNPPSNAGSLTLMPSYTCPPKDANGSTIPPGSCCAYWYAGTGNQTDTDIPEEFWCPPGTFTKPEVPCAHSGTASSSATAGEVVAVVAVLGVAGAAGLYLSRHHPHGGAVPGNDRDLRRGRR